MCMELNQDRKLLQDPVNVTLDFLVPKHSLNLSICGGYLFIKKISVPRN
jgi:hypothetical protein